MKQDTKDWIILCAFVLAFYIVIYRVLPWFIRWLLS